MNYRDYPPVSFQRYLDEHRRKEVIQVASAQVIIKVTSVELQVINQALRMYVLVNHMQDSKVAQIPVNQLQALCAGPGANVPQRLAVEAEALRHKIGLK